MFVIWALFLNINRIKNQIGKIVGSSQDSNLDRSSDGNLIKEMYQLSRQHINLYDMSNENFNQFKCIKSAKINEISTTLCVHDQRTDTILSETILRDGIWEKNIISLFVNLLKENTKLNVIDIGANIGQYCLFAAKMDRLCVAVEPFLLNYLRLNKAAQIEGISDKITMVVNGVTESRGEIKKLTKIDNNISFQKIDNANFSSSSVELLQKRYFLSTIVLDDLVTILPIDFKEAILKIDIENYELLAFKYSKILFYKVKINVIIMNWSIKKIKI